MNCKFCDGFSHQLKAGMGKRALAAVLIAFAGLSVVPAKADSLDAFENLSQDQFETVARNLSAATHYKSISPVEPLGTLGFDVGLEISSTNIDDDLFDIASSDGFSGGELIVPRVHVHKGLPFGLDVGASLSQVPDSDFSIIGGELRYSFVEGGVISPAIGIRLTHSRVEGASDFDLNSTGLEASISKGILIFTPYAGAGIVRSNADPVGVDTLSEETYDQRKIYVGVTMNIGFALTAEVERTGDYRTYSVKGGIRF
ncbi:MAG: hypothetical protein AB8B63_05800 [Granulosicoccus sp.]